MDRRDAIKRLITGGVGMTSLSGLLAACRKSQWPDSIPEPKVVEQVVIIGAGVSGLHAANLLHQAGHDVFVLEASDRLGGRVLSVTDFTDTAIELGAEDMWGEDSTFHRLADAGIQKLVAYDLKEYLMLDGFLRQESELEDDVDFLAARTFIENLGSYTGPDITVSDFLLAQHVPDRILSYINAHVGNRRGSSDYRISMKGVAGAAAQWSAGYTRFGITGPLRTLFERAWQAILPKIRFSTIARTIDYREDMIVVTDQRNVNHTATKVIVTVPIPILREGDITFNPPLPSAKTVAIERIGMGAGIKVALKFQERFWESDSGMIVTAGRMPEFWPAGYQDRSRNANTLVGTAMGDNAEALLAMGPNMIPTILRDLDQMYGIRAASGTFVQSLVKDWSAEPFIRGAYSYPMLGEGDARDVLAASLDDKVYFAGEATHTGGHYGTIHGAMETAERAVDEIIG